MDKKSSLKYSNISLRERLLDSFVYICMEILSSLSILQNYRNILNVCKMFYLLFINFEIS